MKSKFLLTIALFVGLFYSNMNAQIIKTVGAIGADFPTLKAAFDAINANTGGIYTGDITLNIIESTIETDSAVINESTVWNSIKIFPTVSGKKIYGGFDGTLIWLNGADNVTIDGRVNATGTDIDLAIINESGTTHKATQNIKFTNDAQNNTVKYCIIKGSGTSIDMGTIVFKSPKVNGNNNNVITNNKISAIVNRTFNCIYSAGAAGIPNINNTISDNEFYNAQMTNFSSTSITLTADNNSWTISGNSFYETAEYKMGANSPYRVINILGGFGYKIDGNYIGGNAAKCKGMFVKGLTAAKGNAYSGIYLKSDAGAVSTVSNNTIQNISWTNATKDQWSGIETLGVGDVNITGNSVGDNTTTGSIIYTGGHATAIAQVYGILISNTGAVDCQFNKIGSITSSNPFGASINAIQKNAGVGTSNISNNIIGSINTLNSIHSTVLVAQNVNGISNLGTDNKVMNDNIISNLTNATLTGEVRGIKITDGVCEVNGNFIQSFSTPNATTASMYGISMVKAASGLFANNIINLGANTPNSIYGIADLSENGANRFYHNTVYVSGAPIAGVLNSNCFNSKTLYANNSVLKNNLFINARSNAGATGMHSAENIFMAGFTSDYNDYIASGTGAVLAVIEEINIADLAALKVASFDDAHSVSIDPKFAVAGGKMATDYKTASIVNLVGVGISEVTNDYSKVTRSVSSPIMGAFETFDATYLQDLKNSNIKINRSNYGIELSFDGNANIELYNLQGIMIDKTNVYGTYSHKLNAGIYIIRVNNQTYKVL